GGGGDAFVARLSADLKTLVQATYLGGSGYDSGYFLATHPTTGDIYLGGDAESTDFPGTTGGAQSSSGGGGGDAFVARLTADLQAGPTVSSIVLANSSPTAAASVTWTVTFSTAVTGLSASHFALVPNGITGAAITNVSEISGTGANATWTVTASTGVGDGTLGLNMVNATGVTPTVTNLPFTGEVYTITHTHIVTPVAGAGGTINPNTPPTVNDGATTTFTVTPDPNYAIQTVTGCGGTLAGTTYTTGPITADCTVYASFVATAYSLTVSQAGVGSGTVTGSGINCGVSCTATYPVGTSVTLTATPNAGSTFMGWSGACIGTGNCTVTMDAVQTVIGLFGVTTAKTLTVNKTADTNDGSCDAADCSLREAVGAANPGDTVDFAPSLNGGPPVVLDSVITLNKSLTIHGPGASQLAIDGQGLTRIFQIGAGVAVMLDELTLQSGSADGDGGAIFSDGALLITNSILSGNSADNGGAIQIGIGQLTLVNSTLTGNTSNNNGGAIANSAGGSCVSGPVTVIDGVITGNRAMGEGGALYNALGCTLTVRRSILSGNEASGNEAGSRGGAITNYGFLTVANTTISTSTTSGDGGGIYNGGTAAVTDSTVSGSTADGSGGGIYSEGDLTLINSTVSGNRATAAAWDGYGGGIYNEVWSLTTVINSTVTGNTANFGGGIKSYGPLSIGNSLIAGNTGPSGGQQIWVEVGNWMSQGHNLIGQDNDAGMGDGVTLAKPTTPDFTPATGILISDIIGPLAANGGPTLTHLLVTGGPAVDAGSNVLIPAGVTTDQRGAA
ncbi:MAG: CSLREA domain-containing protein, partial [Candidatus Contendobacter sp.]|nr:CSLREA domain-containing protein [Candidatus Contendobacter sp.]